MMEMTYATSYFFVTFCSRMLVCIWQIWRFQLLVQNQ